MALWKIHCEEDKFPGIWRHWYRQQCVAVGWPPASGFTLGGKSSGSTGWNIARRPIQRMAVGDSIVVSFNGHRVGRIGTITAFRVEDKDWNPLVPSRPGLSHGELGRRIEVRWDLACGPSDQDTLVELGT